MLPDRTSESGAEPKRGVAAAFEPAMLMGMLAGGLQSPGMLAGLGDAAAADSERKAKTQAQEAMQLHQAKLAAAAEFDRIDDNWPEAAQVAARQARLELLSNPKFNPKDVERYWKTVIDASRRLDVGAGQQRGMHTAGTGLDAMAQMFGPGGQELQMPGGGGTGPLTGGPNDDATDDGGAPPQAPAAKFDLGMLAPGLSQGLAAMSTSLLGQAGAESGGNAGIGAAPEVSGPYTRAEQTQFMLDELEAKLAAMPPQQDKFASGALGIYNTATGELVHEAPKDGAGAGSAKEWEVERQDAFEWYASKHGKTAAEVEADPKMRIPALREYAERKRPGLTPYQNIIIRMRGEEEERRKLNSPFERIFIMGENGQPQEVLVRRSELESGAPTARTFYDLEGNPIAGGTPGFSTSPPPSIAAGTQERLAAYDVTLKQITPIRGMLAGGLDVTGPVMGRIRNVQLDKLGGKGMDPKTAELILRLKKLFTSGIFSQGGKTLTVTEMEQAGFNLPKSSDTVGTILTKLQLMEEYTKEQIKSTSAFMPTRQRKQVQGAIDTSVGATPPPPSPTPAPAAGPKPSDIVTVKGKRYKVIAINPATGKPQLTPLP